MKLDHLLTPYAKLKACVRPETTQLEENICCMPSDISLSNIFFESISSGKGDKTKNKQIGLYQSEKLLHSEGNHE